MIKQLQTTSNPKYIYIFLTYRMKRMRKKKRSKIRMWRRMQNFIKCLISKDQNGIPNNLKDKNQIKTYKRKNQQKVLICFQIPLMKMIIIILLQLKLSQSIYQIYKILIEVSQLKLVQQIWKATINLKQERSSKIDTK